MTINELDFEFHDRAAAYFDVDEEFDQAAIMERRDRDLEDYLASRRSYGELYVAATDSGAITISGTTLYYEATGPTWTLGSNGLRFDESDGNGRLTYLGVNDIVVFVSVTVSMTAGAANSQETFWRLGVNGTTEASTETQRKIGTGTDVGAAALQGVLALSQGDYVSLWARNATGANNLTVETANMTAVAL